MRVKEGQLLASHFSLLPAESAADIENRGVAHNLELYDLPVPLDVFLVRRTRLQQ